MSDIDPPNDRVSGSPDDAMPTEVTRPVLPPDPATGPGTDPAATASVPALKERWRDRVWSFRAMLAVALATLVLGGIVGARSEPSQREAATTGACTGWARVAPDPGCRPGGAV